jgi:hypothetical protein
MGNDTEHIEPRGNLKMMQVRLPLSTVGSPSHSRTAHGLRDGSLNASPFGIRFSKLGGRLLLTPLLKRLVLLLWEDLKKTSSCPMGTKLTSGTFLAGLGWKAHFKFVCAVPIDNRFPWPAQVSLRATGTLLRPI